ncbi:retrovirus-related pol polyprotein from transposon TNT 1-94 [Tanacetum coccineum]
MLAPSGEGLILYQAYGNLYAMTVYLHNHKDHLGKFDEKADDGYFIRYSLVSKPFKALNTRRQQSKETFHIIFDESTKAIKFSKPSIDDITIAESERYPPNEYLHHFKPYQRYQVNSNIVQFIEPYERPEPIITEAGTSLDQNDQADQNDQNDHLDASAPNVVSTIQTVSPLSITSMATPSPQDWWSREKHIELVNIVGNLGTGMLIRAMAKEVSLLSTQHPRWVDAMQEELNQFARNKVWTLVPPPYWKTIICSKGIFRNKRDEIGILIKNKERLVAQGYMQEEGINYDDTFALVARLEVIRIFLDFATYMNFIVYHIDVKSAFLNGKLKEEVYVQQPPGFESSEFPNHVCKLDKATYGLKQAPKALYETLSTFLTEHKYQANPEESHLIVVKRNFRYLKGTLGLGLWYPKCSGFDLKGYLDSNYARCNMDRKSTSCACQLLGGKLVCWSAKKQQYVDMSLAEVEYVAAAGCCANIL